LKERALVCSLVRSDDFIQTWDVPGLFFVEGWRGNAPKRG